MYLRTYASIIHIILHQDLWPKVKYNVTLPPQIKGQLGRPKMLRRKGVDEDLN